jgi:hypothetical protein
MSRHRPLDVLALTMVWGWGNRGRGRIALQQALASPTTPHQMGRIVRQSKRGAANGFTALFNAHGRTNVPWLGVAFGTKALYFAGYNSLARPRPLIFDINVWKATQRIRGAPNLPSPRRYVSSAQYACFCSWAEEESTRFVVGADTIEYLLFRYGKTL